MKTFGFFDSWGQLWFVCKEAEAPNAVAFGPEIRAREATEEEIRALDLHKARTPWVAAMERGLMIDDEHWSPGILQSEYTIRGRFHLVDSDPHWVHEYERNPTNFPYVSVDAGREGGIQWKTWKIG